MKKNELAALGLTAEQIRAVQKLHGRDMIELQRKCDLDPDRKKNADLRNAIAAVLLTLHRSASLRRVLDYAANVHYWEAHPEERRYEN